MREQERMSAAKRIHTIHVKIGGEADESDGCGVCLYAIALHGKFLSLHLYVCERKYNPYNAFIRFTNGF